MKQKRFTEEQKAFALRQAASLIPRHPICDLALDPALAPVFRHWQTLYDKTSSSPEARR